MCAEGKTESGSEGVEKMTVETVTPSVARWTMESARENYEVMVSPHLVPLKRWVTSKVQNSHDAEDILQQTLFLAFRHFDQFRFEASVGTWLCRIALNVIRGRLRSPDYSRTMATAPQMLEQFALRDKRHSPLALLEINEVKTKVRSAISRLPTPYRTVVELREMRGLSIRETAAALGLTRPAVKSRQHRARMMLVRFLSVNTPQESVIH
jgi:RNA polymerase sigma-70 factor, ECF subfamily